MFKSVIMTHTLHVHDMFDEIPIMVGRVHVKSLFNFVYE